MIKIALIGATGFVGSYVLKEALSRNHQVTVIVRDPSKVTQTHDRLYVVQGDVMEVESLAQQLKGHDVLISAYNAGWNNVQLYEEFLKGSSSIQEACKKAGVRRYLVVGGAGSLEVAPGKQLVDSPDFPLQWKQGALAAREYLNELKKENELDWVFLSPAIQMNPSTSGKRTGIYRTGFDTPVFNEKGECKISVEDTAVALLDEVEQPRFHRQRFTIAW